MDPATKRPLVYTHHLFLLGRASVVAPARTGLEPLSLELFIAH